MRLVKFNALSQYKILLHTFDWLNARLNPRAKPMALAHKLGRAAYFMLKQERVFDEHKFLAG